MRFSVNISTLFQEHDFLDRFRAAREVGFGAVEMQFPYDFPAADVAAAAAASDQEIVLINVPGGNIKAGDIGLAALPHRRDEYRQGVETARRYAEVLKVRRLNVLAGEPPADADPKACWDAFVENLDFTARALGEIGAQVLIEPVNTFDKPRFFISNTGRAIEAIDQAGAANLAVQYDVYHMERMEGDVVATVERLVDRIGHIQFADVPGRHEPGTGGIDFGSVFAAIERSGYRGWVGAEYFAAEGVRSADTFGWFAPYRAAAGG